MFIKIILNSLRELKDKKLNTGFEKILTFSLVRGFDLVLSLGVITPLITPVMGIS